MFSFQGRATRTSFWLVFLLSIFVSIVTVVFSFLAMPALLIMGLFSPDIASIVSGLLYLLLIPMWIVSIANGVKRFHDRDKSGWWVLISLIPVIGALWIIIECGFLPGTAGPNRFGEDPRPQVATGESNVMRNAMIVLIGAILIALGARAIWAYKQLTKNGTLVTVSPIELKQQDGLNTQVQNQLSQPATPTQDSSKTTTAQNGNSKPQTSKVTVDGEVIPQYKFDNLEAHLMTLYSQYKGVKDIYAEPYKTNFLKSFNAIVLSDLGIPEVTTKGSSGSLMFFHPQFLTIVGRVETKTEVYFLRDLEENQ